MADQTRKSNLYVIRAEDVMTEDVRCVEQTLTIGQVAHLMLRNRVSSYPVTDENGQVVGIVTMTDLFRVIDQMADNDVDDRHLAENIRECKNWPVERVMSRHVKCIPRETPILTIVKDVIHSQIHTFPVMDDKKMVGIIGRRDILNAAFVYS